MTANSVASSLPAQAGIEFQVAAGGGIEHQRLAALLDLQRADVRHGRLLRVAHVLQQRAGGADRQRQLVGAEALQIERAELVGEQARGARELEVPGRPRAQRRARARQRTRCRAASAISSSAGFSRSSSAASAGRPSPCSTREAPGGQIQPREAEVLAVAGQRADESVAALLEQRRIGDRAGRDDAHHLALERALGTAPGRPAARRWRRSRPCAPAVRGNCPRRERARPPSGSAAPADWPRAVRVMSSSAAARRASS